jgi:hypothetical protein
MSLTRRELVTWGAGVAAASGAAHAAAAALPELQGTVAAARDERYWAQVAAFYESPSDLLNLEHGYWGKMAKPV